MMIFPKAIWVQSNKGDGTCDHDSLQSDAIFSNDLYILLAKKIF